MIIILKIIWRNKNDFSDSQTSKQIHVWYIYIYLCIACLDSREH